MSEQKKPTSRRSGAPSQRRRSSTAQQRQTAKRGGMPPWLHEWIAQLAIVCATHCCTKDCWRCAASATMPPASMKSAGTGTHGT